MQIKNKKHLMGTKYYSERTHQHEETFSLPNVSIKYCHPWGSTLFFLFFHSLDLPFCGFILLGVIHLRGHQGVCPLNLPSDLVFCREDLDAESHGKLRAAGHTPLAPGLNQQTPHPTQKREALANGIM